MDKPRFTSLGSPRLILRHFSDSDLEPFFTYRNNPEVARYQDWESIGRQEASEFIQEQKLSQPGNAGEGFQFAIELIETGEMIGDCYLMVKEGDSHQAEIGVTLSPRYQRRGLASEAVTCVLDYVFGELSLHRAVAITDCENVASVALLERLGMRREGHFMQNVWFKGKWADEYVYAILQDEWLRIRDAGSSAS
jgi:RimJ/RimL family protein N-acetyltransferase